MTSQAVGPGRRLAGRYRVEDLLDDDAGARSWRAVDEILHRPVYVQTLSTGDPRAEHLATAARAVSMAEDPRLLRVLDVAEEDGTTFVVREWLAGVNLADLLTAGPLPPEQAAALTREVGEALAAAHGRGLAHLRLDPTMVLIAPDGTVKVAGLGTEAVLHGVSTPAGPSEEAAAEDAAGTGRLLYAALTGRWPGPPVTGLPPAPLVDGRLASPRQVRPGIPRHLDEVADRALGSASRHHHGGPLATPGEVAAALARAGHGQRGDALRGVTAEAGPVVLHPALLEMDSPAGALARTGSPGPLPPGEPAVTSPPRRGRPRRRLARALGFVAGLLMLAGATLLGLQLLLSSIDSRGGSQEPAAAPATERPATPSPTPTAGGPVKVSQAMDYDPAGDGSENSESAPAAVDGDPDTAWLTSTYFDPMEAIKPGVGLVLDLAEDVRVSAVRLTLVGETTDVEVRVAPRGEDSPPDAVDDWTTVGSREDAGSDVEVRLDRPRTTRFLLVWLTRLPPEGGDFRGGIAEAEVLG